MTKKKSDSAQSASYPEQETYKGRRIVIRAPEETSSSLELQEGATMLTVEIDEDSFDVIQTGPAEFESIILPYQTYDSPVELAKDAIDYVPRFQSRSGS